jgi:lytic murein transglycosylase
MITGFPIRLSFVVLILLTLCLAGTISSEAAPAASRAKVERAFQAWIKGPLRRKAKSQGISPALFARTFKTIRLNWKLPDLIPPGIRKKTSRPHRQSEFRSPGVYFKQSQINNMVRLGRRELSKWKKQLDVIERRYGVPRGIIIAIWGKETAFGRAALPFNAVSVLATQAFMGRRKQLFETELLAALHILQQGHIPVGKMRSAWAGALGHPQFMPTAFLKYAVDFDGDRRKNIWTSVPDALASIANFLKQNGWNRHRKWGFEVVVPNTISCILEGPDQGMSFNKWHLNNVRRIKGRSFPRSEIHQKGHLLMPAGRFGPTFIVTENFYVLKKYNESDVYALYVGHLNDRFLANSPFKGQWKKLFAFTRRNVHIMQTKLVMLGYDVGGVDGLIGYKTRTSFGEWQTKNKNPATCYPTPALLRSLQ